MAWRDARSIETLRNQLNAIAPNRSKSTERYARIAAAHGQNPTSDHEPNASGVVTAFDVTHDPAGGMDARAWRRRCASSAIAEQVCDLRSSHLLGDEITLGVASLRRGERAPHPHPHLGVFDSALYDDAGAWTIGVTATPPTASSALRQAMGQQIVNFEAQRDAQGRNESL